VSDSFMPTKASLLGEFEHFAHPPKVLLLLLVIH
jgi:hypothetical protein